MTRQTERRFPDGFLFGCATAAHQVEGGLDNDWSAFEEANPGMIKGGELSGKATDHFSRYREDLQLLADRGQTIHRFSVEWSRVEPHEGHFDVAALRHYRDVARTCRELGMTPCVTLHHFTLPRWLSARGGLVDKRMPRLFARYAAAVAEMLIDDVEWWVTINEPTVLAVLGYLYGDWPPQKQSLPECFVAYKQLLRMHVAGTHALRTVAAHHGATIRISVAHHERRLLPADDRAPLDRLATLLPDYLFNRWFLDACASGRMLPPVGLGERIDGLQGSLDYLGLNYYTQERMRFDASSPQTMFTTQVQPTDHVTTMGWRMDPGGLHDALVNLWRRYRLPILITENGVPDEHDEVRPQYIMDHCNAVLDAINDGADVRGYIYWTSTDNFEWLEGYSMKFGLFSVDRGTLERTPKFSASLFEEICRSGRVPSLATTSP